MSSAISNLFEKAALLNDLGFYLDEGNQVYIGGLAGSSISMVAAPYVERNEGTHLFVLNDKEEAAYFQNELTSLLKEKNVYFYPDANRYAYEQEISQDENILLRTEALEALMSSRKIKVIVSYPEALSENVISKKGFTQSSVEVEIGNDVGIEFLQETLFDLGFEQTDFVYRPGQFSIRGGIMDVFSYSNDDPFRLEFFGNEVESIRVFDAYTQLSKKSMHRLKVFPNLHDRKSETQIVPFLKYLGAQAHVWIKDVAFTLEKMNEEYDRAAEKYASLDKADDFIPPDQLYSTGRVLEQNLEDHRVVEFGINRHLEHAHSLFSNQKPQPHFNKNFELLADDLKKNTKAGVKNYIFSSSAHQIERLHAIFDDIDQEVQFETVLFPIHEGFLDLDLKVACYTDHQIFDRYHRFHLKEGYKKNEQALTLKDLTRLKKGDFVVHIDHGHGQYDGLEVIDVNGKKQEAVRILYSGGDLLYLSIHSLHRISRYTSKEGKAPKISKLGSPAWKRLKAKTKKKVKEIAFDLIKLYAERKAKKGFRYSEDSFLQHELEASFLYEDTPDQEKATEDVKTDMEAEAPMDRLICGDVGFGKTEIAIRAAFKAAADGKQVAVLAPTTILTYQHFKTFSKRLENFPVEVDYINRFKSSAQQRESLRKLAEGKTDIIIGTHRLVSNDVKFKDLGMLIVDEEQKFGVAVKDKLKTVKTNVDTLTLTATPIPRTLQFSLMNARDLSSIKTPPPNRLPVQTELKAFSEHVIRDAINYEVARNGQVFFVHNRIQNIQEVAGMVQKFCPNVTIGIAHGQMEGAKLEKVMMQFIQHEFDVLISTSIIESGLDIPNANTIIINQANHFGLSDLHQLRGRVGRSNKKAFCYLLSPPLSSLTKEARQRLKAIAQFSDLGSGFSIAMRDLDIRGAGDLLGGEQSGFISEVGLDVYHKILDEAIQELKENEFKDVFKEELEAKKRLAKDVQIDTDLEFNIPHNYVNQIDERFELYKELSGIENEKSLQEYLERLVDRFGPAPEEVLRMVNLIRLRRVAKEIGFEKVVLKKSRMIAYFPDEEDSPYFQSSQFQHILEHLKTNPREVMMKQKNQKLYLRIERVNDLDVALRKMKNLRREEALAP